MDQRLRAKHVVVSNWQAKTFQAATTRYRCRTRQERNFVLQRPGAEMGSFASIAGAETALAKEFSRHVFEIAALLRVSQTRYNYRVCVVGMTGIEPVTPSMSTRCSPAELRALNLR